ncbi:MAG: VF530 family protein [Polyangiaceae bacterium]
MSTEQPKNPLHGITLETVVTDLVSHLGWETMAEHVKIRCFQLDPSVKSSLTFLRRTPWARAEVEALWLNHHDAIIAKNSSNAP